MLLRAWAAMLGASLMVGEAIRSWGQDRNFLFVVDDFLVGAPLVVMAFIMARPSTSRFAALASCFAGTAGMLYGSFFSKLIRPDRDVSSNIGVEFLTILIGLAFFSSLIGLWATLISASRYNHSFSHT